MINTIKILKQAIYKAKSFECFSYKQELIKMFDELENEHREIVQLMIDVLSYHMNENNPKQLALFPIRFERWFDASWIVEIERLAHLDLKICHTQYGDYYALLTPEEANEKIIKYLDFEMLNKTLFGPKANIPRSLGSVPHRSKALNRWGTPMSRDDISW
ncbi:hypothetical protein [Bacillus sp. B15-48]|uniref:hypothetical protein n=1 Tax=Bacillus sp. B15-48 TaxID=1548601 RepID=UPI00193FFA90|nr:hypothetical protein [Bacillus sp. B15-48]MBM4764704.1 hypothetical protein [Bacillus sp. B15-48]